MRDFNPRFPFPVPTALEKCLRGLGHFIWLPNPGNCGDSLIALSTEYLFKRWGLDYEVYDTAEHCPNRYTLVMGGGGGLVPDWGFIPKISPVLLDPRIERCVILPSSFRGCEELLQSMDSRYTLFCRENESYDFCCKNAPHLETYLVHDMAFYFDPTELPPEPEIMTPLRMPPLMKRIAMHFSDQGKEELKHMSIFLRRKKKRLRRHIGEKFLTLPDGRKLHLFLRRDREKKCESAPKDILPLCMDISRYGGGPGKNFLLNQGRVYMMLESISRTDVVVTDRLHVSVAAAMMGKEVLMLDNNYGKVFGVCKHSMPDFPNIHRFDSLSAALLYVGYDGLKK